MSVSSLRRAAVLSIAAGALAPPTAQALPDNSIDSREIARHAVNFIDLAPNAVTPSKIRPGAVRSPQVLDNDIKGVDVDETSLDFGVLQRRVADGCALGSAIRAITVTGGVECQPVATSDGTPAGAAGPAGGDLTGSYPDPVIAAAAVTAAKLAAGAVTTAKLADDAVTGAKLADPLELTQSGTQPRLSITSSSSPNIPDPPEDQAVLTARRTNTNSVGPALYGGVSSIFGNFGTAGVMGESTGTGGFAGLFHASNPSGNGASLVSIADGNGNAITANASKAGNAVEANVDESGTAVYGWVPSFATGRAARFSIFNESNTNPVVTASTVGNGTAVDAKVDRVTGTSPAVKGEVNSQFSNFGTAGVYGVSSGTGGYAGLFYASNPAGNAPGVLALTEGSGNGLTANAGQNGDGVETTADGNGNSLYAWTPNFGTGRAARLVNFNTTNTNSVLHVETRSAGDIAVFRSGGTPANVARIDATGKGFFNGGTQTGGADLAEVVPTCSAMAPGDVVEIDPDTPDCFRLARTAGSTLVAGVVSTEPGVTLNAKGAEEEDDRPALALAGRVPVKVTATSRPIRIGDLLVASSKPGRAMRASADPAVGTVIGKALESFSGDRGTITMLVMSR